MIKLLCKVDFFGKRFLLIICVAVVLYSIFFIFSDLTFVYEKIIHFDLKFLPLILITIFISWLILFVRWYILTKRHGIHIKTKENLLVFLSGFALAISPVKSGELIKSIILKNNFSIDRSKTVPIILIERFYDILGTFAVAMIGITFLGFGPGIVLFSVLVFLIFVFTVAYSKRGFKIILWLLTRIKFLNKYSTNLEQSHEIIRKSFTPQIICGCTSLTILFRIVEAIGISFVFLAIGVNLIDFFQLASIYSASIILGSISMSPGGLGVTEGSFAGLLTLQGFELQATLVLAIIIRFFTLWFAVIVGLISLRLLALAKKKPKS